MTQTYQVVGEALGWDNIRREQEVAHYVAQVEANQLAAQELTDAATVAARHPILQKLGP